MNTNHRTDDQNESNAGAGMNDNSGAVQKAVRKNASHPGDASHAAGMRRGEQTTGHDEQESRDPGTERSAPDSR